MESRNIILSLLKDLLLKFRLIAVKRGTSVSRMRQEALEEIADDDTYERARKRHLRSLREGADLGSYGQIGMSRDALHERE